MISDVDEHQLRVFLLPSIKDHSYAQPFTSFIENRYNVEAPPWAYQVLRPVYLLGFISKSTYYYKT